MEPEIPKRSKPHVGKPTSTPARLGIADTHEVPAPSLSAQNTCPWERRVSEGSRSSLLLPQAKRSHTSYPGSWAGVLTYQPPSTPDTEASLSLAHMFFT